MNQNILLSTKEEALEFLASHQSTKEPIEFDLGEPLKTLQILIEGDGYSGQLTGEIARALGQYQDAIYNFARLVIFEQPNARLTIEQKKKLELLIEVDEGCLDLKVNFGKLFDALKEPLSKNVPNCRQKPCDFFSPFSYRGHYVLRAWCTRAGKC